MTHGFRGFSSWLFGHCFGPVGAQYIVGVHGRGAAHVTAARKQRERSRQDPNIPFEGTPPVTQLQVGNDGFEKSQGKFWEFQIIQFEGRNG